MNQAFIIIKTSLILRNLLSFSYPIAVGDAGNPYFYTGLLRKAALCLWFAALTY
jgi:hypothetical protein